MTKYYRVRTQEQWEWLMKWFEEQDRNIRWYQTSKLPTEFNYDDVDGDDIAVEEYEHEKLVYSDVDYYQNIEDVTDFIEASQMMEESRMEDYVTIKGEDVEKLKNEQGDSLFFMSDKRHFAYSFIEGFDCSEVNIPKSLLYPKVKMSVIEKEEFDKLRSRTSLLHMAINCVSRQCNDYPQLCGKLFQGRSADGNVKSQNEFARAWADESLIEIIPDKKWNVKVPISCNDAYYNKVLNDCKDAVMVKHDVDKRSLQINNNFKFTAEELKYYGLDNDLFEKVEVLE